MKKILFLYKSKSLYIVIFYFLINKITKIFFKNKILAFKRNHKKLLLTKKISEDYFSSNSFYFYYFLKKLKKDFSYLEIGSFEGSSALFVSNKFEFSKVYCVDCWIKTEEYSERLNFTNVEDNFDSNIKYNKNITKIKKTSDDFFKDNEITFYVIYIDGYHYGPQVYTDCVNALKKLKKNGFLICDDFIWRFYEKIDENPCYAISKFLRENKNVLKVKKVSNSQIFLKKVK